MTLTSILMLQMRTMTVQSRRKRSLQKLLTKTSMIMKMTMKVMKTKMTMIMRAARPPVRNSVEKREHQAEMSSSISRSVKSAPRNGR
jgi:hypothetical protein